MIKHDQEHWQRLRKDKRSAFAVMSVSVAAMVTIIGVVALAVPGTQATGRANPLYWLIMVPAAYWVSSLLGYEPWAVATFRFSLVILPLVAVVALLWSLERGEGVTAHLVLLGLSGVFSMSAELFYRGSLLQREGPAR